MLVANNIRHDLPALSFDQLTVAPNRVTGIIGPNGAGKSTTLKMLSAILKPQDGDVLLDGQSIYAMPSKQRARHIAYLEQHCFVHWPLTCEKLIELGRFPYQGHDSDCSKKNREIVNSVIEQLGLEKFRQRSVLNLSGGERIRVLLARSLATQADYLLVDEPVASLDLQYQFEIMQILQEQAKSGVGVAVILHDMNLAAQFCDYLYLLQDGKLTAQGNPQEVFTRERLAQVFGVNAEITEQESHLKMLFSQLS